MALELNGTTGVSLVQDGVVTSAKIADGAVAAADLSSTLDLTGKTVTLPAGVGGKIRQIVHSTPLTGDFEVTSNSFTDVTGLTLTVTPISNNSLIVVTLTCLFGGSTNLTNGRLKFVTPNGDYFNKNNGESETDTEGQFRHNSNGNTMRPVSFVHSYVNSSTADKTWKVQIRVVSGSNPYGARLYGGGKGDSLISAVEYDLS